MEIKTKFNIGDTLFTIKNMHVISFNVKAVSAFSSEGIRNVNYMSDAFDFYKEADCFKTKEGLLAFIQGDNR